MIKILLYLQSTSLAKSPLTSTSDSAGNANIRAGKRKIRENCLRLITILFLAAAK